MQQSSSNPGNQFHLVTAQAVNQAVDEYKADVEALAKIKCTAAGSSVVSDANVWDAVSDIRVKDERRIFWRWGLGYALEVVGLAVLVFGLQLSLGIDILATDEAKKLGGIAATTLASLSFNSGKMVMGFGIVAMIVGGLCAVAGAIIKEG